MTDIRKELPAHSTAAADARHILNGWLTASVGDQTANDIRLATTELISNAVRHGGLGEQDVIVLSASIEDVVRVYIEQPTAIPFAEVKPSAPLIENGMGLRIVDAIANRWGVDPGPPGVVWFELDK